MAFKIIVMGVSLGGLPALEIILSALPESFPLPLIIAQHDLHQDGNGLAKYLQKYSALSVDEPNDKDPILPNRVYIAPADYHLLIEPESFSLSTDAPMLHARPSINALFESAADVYSEAAIGVILTGGSIDGVQGITKLKAAGGYTIVQDPASAECVVMPQAAIATGVIDDVLALSKIAPCLMRLCNLPVEKPYAG